MCILLLTADDVKIIIGVHNWKSCGWKNVFGAQINISKSNTNARWTRPTINWWLAKGLAWI